MEVGGWSPWASRAVPRKSGSEGETREEAEEREEPEYSLELVSPELVLERIREGA